MRAPDVAYYASRRWASVQGPDGYLEVPPNLAVEVVSPGDGPREVRDKVAAWLAAGVALVWVVDPRARTIAIHRLDGSTSTVAKPWIGVPLTVCV